MRIEIAYRMTLIYAPGICHIHMHFMYINMGGN